VTTFTVSDGEKASVFLRYEVRLMVIGENARRFTAVHESLSGTKQENIAVQQVVRY
jgi:hypothetical protein